MKRFYIGLSIFDTRNIRCISFSAGCAVIYFSKKCKNTFVIELKEKYRAIMFSNYRKLLKVPLGRKNNIIKSLITVKNNIN